MNRFNLLLATLFAGISTLSFTAVISGNVDLGENRANYIYLYQYIGKNYFVIDSALIDKKSSPSKFSFNIKQSDHEIFRIGIEKLLSVEFLYSNQNDHLTIDYTNGVKFTTPSQANINFQNYRNAENSFDKEVELLSNQMKNLQRSRLPKIRLDSMHSAIMTRYNVALLARTESYKEIYLTTKNALLKEICTLFILDTLNAENFISPKIFKNNSLMHGDFIYRKIDLYLSSYGKVTNQNIVEKLNDFFKYGPNNSIQRQVIYETAIIYSYKTNENIAAQYAENFIREYPKSSLPKVYIKVFPPMLGAEVPDINLTNPKGKSYKLSDLRGQIVLIDFWASWCGPCRKENPVVVEAYKTYKDKGFTVFSISLDKEKSRWEAAIEQDKLQWPYHVSELEGWSGLVNSEYKVSGIPASFLIDREGKLIARNLRGSALQEKLKEILAQ